MTINHIGQLAQWWDEAEEGVIEKGDTVINRSDGETTVYVATERARRHHTNARILARAPKPKPAWHDAVAVMADTPGRPERRVFIRDVEQGWWSDADSSYETDELAHVTPLIEAKVTDEMIVRAANAWTGNGYQTTRDLSRDLREDITHALTAALGLETT